VASTSTSTGTTGQVQVLILQVQLRVQVLWICTRVQVQVPSTTSLAVTVKAHFKHFIVRYQRPNRKCSADVVVTFSLSGGENHSAKHLGFLIAKSGHYFRFALL